MKALVYTKPETLEFTTCDDPYIPDSHSLVKVMAAGICGSDMHAFLAHDERRPPPLILGHEAAGIVVTGQREGERVTINPLVTCGTCKSCQSNRENLCPNRQIISMAPRPGAFAQYVAVPDKNLIAIPEKITFEKASLAEPIACGWHAVRLAAQTLDIPITQASCFVIGGGAIGLGAALVLKAKGAKQISIAEPNTKRRKVLEKIANFNVFDPQDTQVSDIDLVIDGVGYAATRTDACRAVRPGGVISHIGLGQSEDGIDVRRLTLQEITLIGTYTYTVQDFHETAQAIFKGNLGNLDWMETRPLALGQSAFEDIRSSIVSAPKIILHPWDQG